MTRLDPRRLLPPIAVHTLANGLQVCLLQNHLAPIVATALIYRVGTRDETPAEAGAAHFLEHMMFKGSQHFAAGEIDRVTQSLGGSNNAFTNHDSTLYYFTFAADRWQQALRIEADRMAGLLLEPHQVTSERQVILEEIAMYEGDPWDALDQEVATALYGEHPYGRPVLGTRDSLAAIDDASLRDFHRRHYGPDNAVLVLAGDIDSSALDVVQECFGHLEPRGDSTTGTLSARPVAADGPRRVVRHQGESARMLLSLPVPAGTAADHPHWAVLSAVLGAGRSSRLHRALVDESELCIWASAEVHETLEPGQLQIALEAMPGVATPQIEARLFEVLADLRRDGPTAEEVARARRVILADWVFAHERVHQQAFFAATAVALFDIEHPWRYFDSLQQVDLETLQQLAATSLNPEAGVLGWSLPVAEEASHDDA